MDSVVDILLVDDDKADAELAIMALKQNYIVNNLVHLRDGAEAIDFIFAQGQYSDRRIENSPRIILLDLKMPKVNGLQVLQKLKSDERTKKIPVVVLTSSKESPDIRACYDLGVNSYVVKPIQFDKFVSVIRDLGLYWIFLNQTPL